MTGVEFSVGIPQPDGFAEAPGIQIKGEKRKCSFLFGSIIF
jgi:hypothetical protein